MSEHEYLLWPTVQAKFVCPRGHTQFETGMNGWTYRNVEPPIMYTSGPVCWGCFCEFLKANFPTQEVTAMESNAPVESESPTEAPAPEAPPAAAPAPPAEEKAEEKPAEEPAAK